jgi:hypothetical protein
MCCRHELPASGSEGCCCVEEARGEGRWLSRKKKVEALKDYLARLESRVEDVREYLRELEA